MADAPGHLLGQIIGNTLEDSLEPLLRQVAVENGLYLDKKGICTVCGGPIRYWGRLASDDARPTGMDLAGDMLAAWRAGTTDLDIYAIGQSS